MSSKYTVANQYGGKDLLKTVYLNLYSNYIKLLYRF